MKKNRVRKSRDTAPLRGVHFGAEIKLFGILFSLLNGLVKIECETAIFWSDTYWWFNQTKMRHMFYAKGIMFVSWIITVILKLYKIWFIHSENSHNLSINTVVQYRLTSKETV